MSSFQRARKPEEKAVRRQSILEAARELAEEVGPHALGLNELGRRAGVSKPNIYRYFESREHVLLSLFLFELEDLADELERRLSRTRGDVSRIARGLAASYAARPLLCQLLGLVASVLEHNIGAEAILESKRTLVGISERVVTALSAALPALSRQDALWAAQSIALYVGGLWPAAHPSEPAAAVLSRPELAGVKPDFERDLERFVRVLLRGLVAPPA